MSEKILIIGKNSKISKEFIKKIPQNTAIIQPDKKQWNMDSIDFNLKKINIIRKADKILLLQSVVSAVPF